MMTNLIYDRTPEDVAEVRRLLAKLDPETGDGLTAAEQAKWDAGLKGAYNFTDLNRVESAVKLLTAALTSAGYPVEVTPVLKGSSRLPAGYTEVEWIQSSGTQYIDTGFAPNQDTRVVVEMQLTDPTLEQTPFLARTASNKNSFGVFLQIAGWAVDYGTLRLNFPSEITATERLSLDFNKTKATMNGKMLTFSAQEFLAPVNLFLFVRNTNGALNGYAIAKLYFCRIYDNGTLIRDFIPCKNPSGTVGLYDLVEGQFYGNSGTGAFTAGAEIGKIEDREWQEGDIVRRAQWTTYLDNVQKLRDAYYTLSETGELPKPEDKLDYQGANTIEKILADIDLLIDCMKSSYRRCGTFRAGNNAAHLPLKGSI